MMEEIRRYISVVKYIVFSRHRLLYCRHVSFDDAHIVFNLIFSGSWNSKNIQYGKNSSFSLFDSPIVNWDKYTFLKITEFYFLYVHILFSVLLLLPLEMWNLHCKIYSVVILPKSFLSLSDSLFFRVHLWNSNCTWK